MIDIRVDRISQIGDTTLSRIFIDNEPICYGLEDIYRDVKVYGETRIPAGTYPLTRRYEGKHFRKYNRTYRHKSSLWIRDVPNFKWIMIHAGNTAADTEGCLLTGSSVTMRNGSDFVTASVEAYRRLYTLISKRIDSEGATITFRDLDRCRSACTS